MAKQLAADIVDAVLTIRPPPPSAGKLRFVACLALDGADFS